MAKQADLFSGTAMYPINKDIYGKSRNEGKIWITQLKSQGFTP